MTDPHKKLSISCGLFFALIVMCLLGAVSCSSISGGMRTVAETPGRAMERLYFPDRYDSLEESETVADARPGDDILMRSVEDSTLTLAEARAVALSLSPDAEGAFARLQSAKARVMQAASRFYPTVVFSHNSTRTFHTPANRNRLNALLQPSPTIPSDVQSDELNTEQNVALNALLTVLARPLYGNPLPRGNHNTFSEHSTSLTATWTIFDSFAREAQYQSTRYLERASKYALADAQRLIIHAIDTAYYQVQLAEEQIRVSQADESFSRDQLLETQKLQKAARASQADVDNFKVRVLAAQSDLRGAIGLRDTGMVVLAELMGVDDLDLPEGLRLAELADESAEELASADPVEWVQLAVSNRPDLRQMEQMVHSQRERVRSARGAFGPTLAVSGSYGFDHSSNLGYSVEDQSAGAAFELRWDLFSGGSRKGRVLEEVGRRTEYQSNLRKLRLSIHSDTMQAIIDLGDAQEQINLQREALATSAENRRVIQAAYLGGKETLNRLNEAQRDYTTADANLALARIRLRQAWSDLRSAAAVWCHNGEEVDANDQVVD